MSYRVEQNTVNIDKVLDKASVGRTRYPGMSYEDGIRDAILWITDIDADPIFGDDE